MAAGALRHRLLAGLPTRFFPGATADETPKLVWRHAPDLAEAVIRTADAAVQGTFDLLGYRGLRFGEPIDWHLDPVSGRRSPLIHWSRIQPLDPEQIGDSKVIWELGRQQWAIHLAQSYRLTGDARYAEAAVRAIVDWRHANPPGLGIHWTSSLELACRTLSWLWTLALCRDAQALTPDVVLSIVDSIDRQAQHVARHLSYYFSPNTHLTGEALGLLAVGIALPELRDAARWRDLGARILIAECPRQIRPDGTHFEQAMCYQRYTAELYLQFLVLATRNGLLVPAVVAERVQRLLDALLWLRLPDGSLSPMGDADGGWLFPQPGRAPGDMRGVFALAAAYFGRADYAWAAGGLAPEAIWILGPQVEESFDRLVPAPPAASPSRVFPDGGLVVMRSDWGPGAHQLILDAGPFGDPVSGAHGHADLLSVQVAAFGTPVVVDAGTGTYTPEPRWRSYFRGSHAHSTVVVDGQSQATPAGPFAWVDRPAARLTRWTATGSLEVADGEHDAYAWLAEPVRHRRRVLFVDRRFWVIVDELAGAGEHTVEVRFQLAQLPVAVEQDSWTRIRTSGTRGCLVRAFAGIPIGLRIVEGALDPIEGWVSLGYGLRRPAPALVYSARTRLPLKVVTLLWPVEEVDAPSPAITVHADATGAPVALVMPGDTVLGLEGAA
jgi:Heparinase II/III-like protein/Heparinase II/III N-terminus